MSTASPELETTSVPGSHLSASPDKIFETLTAYQHTEALKAAIELDLFTAIAGGQNTVASLARMIQGSERGVRILCDCLVVLGFLTKTDHRYGLTAESAAFLDKNSGSYLGSAKNFLSSPLMMQVSRDLATVVRSGRPVAEPFSGIEHPIWVEFARSMAPLQHRPAQETAELLSSESEMKVLDIAAGHGLFGIAIAKRNPRARIVALDFPSVLNVASENAARYGVSDRYSLHPGDALKIDLGSGFDAVLVPNLLHSFDRASNVLLLKKVHAALAPKGRVIIVEFTPNEDRISPRVPALFALIMLANNLGDAYTVSEHRAMLGSAGFPDCEIHPLPRTPFTAIVSVRS
ncbi:MAG: methyltransferase domain-containing protein [Acidobacteriaceae bacterium]|nr:methyltransferase domain-containing protein [Acidobacteriaceae bacterium]MBV9779577.1 methyltransferase domain-containing protein [Acidobacteriaceae bacterium]